MSEIKKLTLDEIEKLVNGNPRLLISKMQEFGINFSELDKDIARKMVKERLHLSEKDFDAADFVFWVAYFVEREAEDLIIEPEVMAGARKAALEAIISKLHFSEKIKIIDELHASKNDPFIKMMRKIQDLRNHVAHGRFGELNYEGYHLSDNRGRLILIADLRDSTKLK